MSVKETLSRVRGKKGPGQVQRDHSGCQARIKKEMGIFECWRAKQKLKHTGLKTILRIFVLFPKKNGKTLKILSRPVF